MHKLIIVGTLTVLCFLFTASSRAQDADEVAKLRREYEQLKKENELLKKEIELLKKDAKVGSPKTGSKDLELLQGTWNIDAMEWGGRSLPRELMTGYKFVFSDKKLTWEAAIGIQSRSGKVSALGDGLHKYEFKIDPSQEPKQIDITMELNKRDRTCRGIYELKGDTLKVCYFASDNGKRPTEFSTKDGINIGLIELTRAKK